MTGTKFVHLCNSHKRHANMIDDVKPNMKGKLPLTHSHEEKETGEREPLRHHRSEHTDISDTEQHRALQLTVVNEPLRVKGHYVFAASSGMEEAPLMVGRRRTGGTASFIVVLLLLFFSARGSRAQK
ncbi:uncharacterized, partial [Tachysurus ichikawai]